jgi:hypothetical protein
LEDPLQRKMASELSKFIEDELRLKGIAFDEEEAPHQTLMGALRVEVRCRLRQRCASAAPAPIARDPGRLSSLGRCAAWSLPWAGSRQVPAGIRGAD